MTTEILNPGTYILAVSGGVDSIVLLDMVRRIDSIEVIVAHVDHGIRSDSHRDAAFVERLAKKHQLQFECRTLALGPNVSEDEARKHRYAFLHECRKKYGAVALVTAHHQDDVLETILINLHRGTGWRGLASLRSTETVRRPLLTLAKTDIVSYAISHQLQWREDSTNSNTKYLRNYMRHQTMPKLDSRPGVRIAIADLWRKQCVVRQSIESEVSQLLQSTANVTGQRVEIPRYALIMMPDAVSTELLQASIVHIAGFRLQRHQIEELLRFSKAAKPHSLHVPSKGLKCRVTVTTLIVEPDTV